MWLWEPSFENAELPQTESPNPDSQDPCGWSTAYGLKMKEEDQIELEGLFMQGTILALHLNCLVGIQLLPLLVYSLSYILLCCRYVIALVGEDRHWKR